MFIQIGDVVIAGSSPGLIIATQSFYGVIVRRFSFTAGGTYRGYTDGCYQASQLNQANEVITQSVRAQALRAQAASQKAIPKGVYDRLKELR